MRIVDMPTGAYFKDDNGDICKTIGNTSTNTLYQIMISYEHDNAWSVDGLILSQVSQPHTGYELYTLSTQDKLSIVKNTLKGVYL